MVLGRFGGGAGEQRITMKLGEIQVHKMILVIGVMIVIIIMVVIVMTVRMMMMMVIIVIVINQAFSRLGPFWHHCRDETGSETKQEKYFLYLLLSQEEEKFSIISYTSVSWLVIL